MGFQPMQAFSIFLMTRPTRESKLAARGVSTLSSNERCPHERQALRFRLGRSGQERKLKAATIAQHGLEAHVTDALLCALSRPHSVYAHAVRHFETAPRALAARSPDLLPIPLPIGRAMIIDRSLTHPWRTSDVFAWRFELFTSGKVLHMSISAVTNAFASYAQNVTGTTGGKTTAGANAAVSSASSALQEATETAAQTKKEAAHGDHVAKAKLAHEAQQQEAAAAASEPGKGKLVDKAA
jgi:hypothetical protein